MDLLKQIDPKGAKANLEDLSKNHLRSREQKALHRSPDGVVQMR